MVQQASICLHGRAPTVLLHGSVPQAHVLHSRQETHSLGAQGARSSSSTEGFLLAIVRCWQRMHLRRAGIHTYDISEQIQGSPMFALLHFSVVCTTGRHLHGQALQLSSTAVP